MHGDPRGRPPVGLAKKRFCQIIGKCGVLHDPSLDTVHEHRDSYAGVYCCETEPESLKQITAGNNRTVCRTAYGHQDNNPSHDHPRSRACPCLCRHDRYYEPGAAYRSGESIIPGTFLKPRDGIWNDFAAIFAAAQKYRCQSRKNQNLPGIPGTESPKSVEEIF